MQWINLVLFLITLLSVWVIPTFAYIIIGISLLFSLVLSTYSIIQKHAGTEHARAKILKDVGVMVFTLIIILFLGGIAAMLANYQVGMRWGEVAGIVSAIGASFGVGYLVRKAMRAIL